MIARERRERLRQLALRGDASALAEWLSQLSRGGGWLDADLSPDQARRLSRTVIAEGLDLASVEAAIKLLQTHSIAFAARVSELRQALAAGVGRRWYRFPRGYVWHSVDPGSLQAACGVSVHPLSRRGRRVQLASTLPEEAPVCDRCRRALATLAASGPADPHRI